MAFALDPVVEGVLALAVDEAKRLRLRHVTLEGLMLGVLRAESGAALLRACGADVADMDRELAEYLELLDDGPPRQPLLDAQVEGSFRMAAIHAQSAGKSSVDLGCLLAAMSRYEEAYACMLLHAQGIDRVDLLRQISHGTREVTARAPEGAEWLRVHLYNDDFTTMEFVVLVLEEVFRLPRAKAQALMLAIHEGKGAVVTTLRRDEAIARVAEVEALAQQAGYPLRCAFEAQA